MSESRHTEGPWATDGLMVKQVIPGRFGPLVARAAGPEGDTECEANARLIAAAPDMLAALKAVEWAALVDDEHGGMEDGCAACDQAQRFGHADECPIAAAIARATGAA